MKRLTIFCIVLLSFALAGAQTKTEKNINFAGKESLEMDIQIADSINIMTWSRNEVLITVSVNVNDNKDNEAYIITFGEEGKKVVVTGKMKDKYFRENDDNCVKTDICWIVHMPEKCNLNIETINGDITIAGITNQLNIKSISGFIDLAVPETRDADITFSTISGTVYTDHKLVQGSKNSGVPTVIKDRLNKGGSQIKLETISGDIFFRRSI